MAISDISPNGSDDEDRKLESWKEIATFFERDLRTVIRWEKELGLPVHRYPGKAKGRVCAQASELKAWADGPRRAAAVAEPEEETASADFVGTTETAAVPDRRLAWVFAAAGVLAAVLLGWFAISRYYPQQPVSSVAVLPFDNLGSESDPAFVGGLTDEISASLSRLGNLRGVGRRSAYTFAGKHDDLRQIGAALNVEAVVEGSVQRSGGRTHVAVQLNRPVTASPSDRRRSMATPAI